MATLLLGTTTNANAPRVKLLTAANAGTRYSKILDRSQFLSHAVSVVNVGGAAVKIFVTMEDVTDTTDPAWVQIGDDITGNAWVILPRGIYPRIYVSRDGTTSGTVSVQIISGDRVNK